MVSSPLVVNYPDTALSGLYDDLLNNGKGTSQVAMPSALASRYKAPGSPRPQAVQAPAAQEPAQGDEIAQWRSLAAQAQEANSAADIAVNRLPALELRARRAAALNDFEDLSAVDGEISGLVRDYGDALTPWADMRDAGPRGRQMSALVNQVLSGQYREAWGMAQLLDDNSEEALSRRAALASKDLGVPAAVGRSLVDRNDPKYAVYGRFAGLLDKTKPGADPVAAQQARDRQTSYFRSVAKLDGRRGSEFDSAYDFADFVSAFDENLNAKGISAGESVLNSAADAYLAQKGRVSPREFVQNYAAAVKALMPPDRPQIGPDGKPQSREQSLRGRMETHEAQALMSAFVTRAARAGVTDDVTVGKYRDVLASAADMTRKLSDLYGIDLRADGNSAAGTADLALSRLGVLSGDGAGLADRIDGVTSRLSLLASEPTRRALQMKQGQKGVAGVPVDEPNPYFQTELAAVRRAGGVLWDLASKYGTEDALRRVEAGGEERERVLSAMAKGFEPRMGARLARGVAEDLIGNLFGRGDPAGGPMMTVEESIRRRGRMPTTTADAVPPGERLSGGDGFDDNDIALLARGEAIKSAKFDQGLRDAQRDMALRLQERAGKTPNFNYHQAAGELYRRLSGSDDVLATSGLLGKLANTSNWSDRAREPQVKEATNGLLGVVRDANVPAPRRAEAMAELLLVAASGADLNEYQVTYSATPAGGLVRGASRVVRNTWGEIRAAARDLGVALPAKQSDYHVTDLVQLARVMPALADSNLVKSGYLNLETGQIDVKNMIRVGQREAAGNPVSNDGRDDPTLSDEQREARRVLSTFETEKSAVATAGARYRDHLLSQGIEGDALNMMEAAAASQFADAYRNDGAAGVDRQLQANLNVRRRYLPVWRQVNDPAKNAPVWVADPERVLTWDGSSDEWATQRAIELDKYEKYTGAKAPDGWLDALQVSGPSTYRDMVALRRAAALAAAKRKPDDE